MTTNYTITTSDNQYLTTIFQAEGNGAFNLSNPHQITDISFDPLDPAFIVSSDVANRFVDGFKFNVIGSTPYDGLYTVKGAAYADLAADGRWYTRIPVTTPINIIGYNLVHSFIIGVSVATTPTLNRYQLTWVLNGDHSATISPQSVIRIQNITLNGGTYSQDFVVETVNAALNQTTIVTYIDAPVAPIISISPNYVATTASVGNLTTYDPNMGLGGFTSAPLTLGTLTLQNGDIVYVNQQTNIIENGTYQVISAGIWERLVVTNPPPSSNILYPPPPYPYGNIQYTNNFASTSLHILGPGSPAYNMHETWGLTVQLNDLYGLENYNNELPPVAPLMGQLWHDNATTLQVFKTDTFQTHDIVDVTTGASGTFVVSGDITTQLGFQIGKIIYVYNSEDGVDGPLTTSKYTIVSTNFITDRTYIQVQENVSTNIVAKKTIDQSFTIVSKDYANQVFVISGDHVSTFITGMTFYVPGDRNSPYTVGQTPSTLIGGNTHVTVVQPIIQSTRMSIITYKSIYGMLYSQDSWYGLVTERVPVNGIIDMNSYRIIRLAYPVDNTDAANKQYVIDRTTLGAGLNRGVTPPEIYVDNYVNGGLFTTIDGVTPNNTDPAQLSIKLDGTSLKLSISGIRLNPSGVIPGEYTKLTVDENGIATLGATASLFDLSNVSYGTIVTNDTNPGHVVAQVDATLYRTVEFTIQVVSGTDYHATKILVIHDGTTATLVEYGSVITNIVLAAFDVIITGNNLQLVAQASTANSTTITAYGIAIPL